MNDLSDVGNIVVKHAKWTVPVFMVDQEIADVMARFIRPGQCVVDAGANYGNFCWLLSRLVGGDGKVIAFEPDRVVFDALRENVRPLSNVVPLDTTLWCRDEELTFYRTPHSGYSSLIQYKDFEEESYPVKARSLDSLGVAPSFMKIDCEGADEAVMRGAEKILRRGVDCVIAEMNFNLMDKFVGCSERSMRDFMNGLGYDCFLLEAHFKPLYVPPDAHINLLQHGQLNNMINVMFASASRVDELWPSKETENG